MLQLTSEKRLYSSSICLAISVPVVRGDSRIFSRTDLLRKTSFLSFFFFLPGALDSSLSSSSSELVSSLSLSCECGILN